MKITICGSILYVHEMDACKKELEALGHDVQAPPLKVLDNAGNLIDALEHSKIRKAADHSEDWMKQRKSELIMDHFKKVEWADAILVFNKDKHEIKNYIGPNTLLEMGVAFYLNKKIYLLNPVPSTSWKEEVLGMMPVVLNGDLKEIK
jgi:hypothetical protein